MVTEPRFLFDVYIQSQADAYQVIKDIAAGFNGMTCWGNNMFNVVSDMPVDTSKIQILTRASVVGKPVYSSGSEKNRYSSALINFSDNEWINVPQTGMRSFEVPGIFEGDYLVRVRAINSGGASSLWASSMLTHIKGRTGNVPKPVGLTATNDVVFGINVSWGFPADAGDTLNTEIQYSMTADGASPMLLADVPYPQKLYQQMGLKAGQEFWYRARLIDRIGNQGDWTEFVGGQASIDVTDITEAVLNQIKDTDLFKDLIESAVDSNQKVADMASAITENADKLAAAVGANKQTAESIIHNALAIANVVVSQSAQNGANSAKFEQLREVIATETEARVTDVTRLEAKTSGNEAGITEVRQALATETEARATAVDELTAKTGDNAAGVTLLTQAVTELDSSTASRFEELSGKTDKASGGIQNTAIALIQNTLAQVNLKQTITAQYGSSIAQIQRIDETTANDREANAQSLLRLESKVNGNGASITNLSQTVANYQQSTATQVAAINASINGVSAGVTTNAQALANIRHSCHQPCNCRRYQIRHPAQ